MGMMIVGETPPPPPIICIKTLKNSLKLIYAIFTNSHTLFKQSRIKEIWKINSCNKMLTQSCIRITTRHILQRGPKPGAGKELENVKFPKVAAYSIFS